MNPKIALMTGGALYATGVAWMFSNYYDRSAFKKIFVSTDANYANVKLMHHP